MQANIAAARSGSEKRFNTQDFLLEFGVERPKPVAQEPTKGRSWQELKFIAQMWAATDPIKG